jgi:hypothetical protein
MRRGEETFDVTSQLARVRHDLLEAVAADLSRGRRRRRRFLGGAAVAATLAVLGTAVAATTGVFAPAPDEVKGTFEELNHPRSPEVDSARAIEVGTIDGHRTFAAPGADGGFCLSFAPAPRSGPSGSVCTVLPRDLGADEIALIPEGGTDGGLVVGRVGAADAATVRVALAGDRGTVTARVVGPDRFFVARVPPPAAGTLRGDPPTAVALDARGRAVARSAPTPTRQLPPVSEPGSRPAP